MQIQEFGHALGLFRTVTTTPSVRPCSRAGYSTDFTDVDRMAVRVWVRLACSIEARSYSGDTHT